jgi:TPR repeat protein
LFWQYQRVIDFGIDNNFEKFQALAAAGFPAAQCALGTCYENGSGVALDTAEAVKWYKRAAEAGNAEAQFNLGN